MSNALYTWVHVSGLQGFERDAGNSTGEREELAETLGERIREGIHEDLRKLKIQKQMAFDAICLTGNVDAYAVAKESNSVDKGITRDWLRRFQKEHRITRQRILLVPGSLDVREVPDPDAKRLARGLRQDDDRSLHVDKAMTQSGERANLASRMRQFLELYREFGAHARDKSVGLDDLLYWETKATGKHGLTVRIVGLNTVLSASGEENRGAERGALGIQQLRSLSSTAGDHEAADSAADSGEFVIVLSHHPLQKPYVEDAPAAWVRMRQNAHVHLSADYEVSANLSQSGTHDRIVVRGVGPRRGEYRYEVSELIVGESGGLVVRVWPRRWHAVEAIFVPDASSASNYKEYYEYDVPAGVGVAPQTGDMFHGRYQLRDRLSQDTYEETCMAPVWEAIDTHMDDDQVVIKILRTFNKKVRDRFGNEARALYHMARSRDERASHIVKYIAHDKDAQGRCFTVMEHLSGERLDEFLRIHGPLKPEQVLEFCRQIALGLGCFHPQWVHRDLKTSNIMVTGDETKEFVLKIFDFGIAREIDSKKQPLTTKDTHLGTVGYMSPEQTLKPHDVDKRSDVWSLGVIVYEMLMGFRPFSEGLTNEIQFAPIPADSPAFRLLGIEDFFRKAFSWSREKRYAGADELYEALHAVVTGGPVAPRRNETGTGVSVISTPTQMSEPAGALPVAERAPAATHAYPATPMASNARALPDTATGKVTSTAHSSAERKPTPSNLRGTRLGALEELLPTTRQEATPHLMGVNTPAVPPRPPAVFESRLPPRLPPPLPPPRLPPPRPPSPRTNVPGLPHSTHSAKQEVSVPSFMAAEHTASGVVPSKSPSLTAHELAELGAGPSTNDTSRDADDHAPETTDSIESKVKGPRTLPNPTPRQALKRLLNDQGKLAMMPAISAALLAIFIASASGVILLLNRDSSGSPDLTTQTFSASPNVVQVRPPPTATTPSIVPSASSSGTAVTDESRPPVVPYVPTGPKTDSTKGPISVAVPPRDAGQDADLEAIAQNDGEVGARGSHPPQDIEKHMKDAGSVP